MRMKKRWRPSLKGGHRNFFQAQQEEEEEEGDGGEGDGHTGNIDGIYGRQRFNDDDDDDELVSIATVAASASASVSALASAPVSASNSSALLLALREGERLQLDTNTGSSSHSYGCSYGYGLLHYFFTASDVSSPSVEPLLSSSLESVAAAASSSKGHPVAGAEFNRSRVAKEKGGVDFHLQPRTPSPKLPSPGIPTELSSVTSGGGSGERRPRRCCCPDLNLLPNPTPSAVVSEFEECVEGGELDDDGDNTMVTHLADPQPPVFYEFLGLGGAAGVQKSKSPAGLITQDDEEKAEKLNKYTNIEKSTEFCLFPSHMQQGFNHEIQELQKLSTKESLIPRYNLEHAVWNTGDLQPNCNNMHGKEWECQTGKAGNGLFNIPTQLMNIGKVEVSKKVLKVKKQRANRKAKKDSTSTASDDLAAVAAAALQQCNRKDGRGWQCSRLVKEGYTYCEHHLVKIKANHARSAMKMAMLRRSLKESNRSYHHNNTIFFGTASDDTTNPFTMSSASSVKSKAAAVAKKLRYCFPEDGFANSAYLYPAASCARVNLHGQTGTINLRGQTGSINLLGQAGADSFHGQAGRVNFNSQTVWKRGMLMVDYGEDDDQEGPTCGVNSDPIDWRLDLC